ncbi:MerR family transcriptional regulator [Paraburkholderia diazotrophica]|uniref:DNA binding domain-containing protein, excisionase family n=1 Tax=Paraburkholderia diazotrophica TaxID=667676 RepID=A0A1H7DZR6_9BURK|nr:hypothetical protein [Paraburkholderia diazotrophica]SEK07259.1 hypothetical protein SAMN05192539_103824 [Paraburkholderia diazotrophica]
MQRQGNRELMSIDEFAQLLNVTHGYVVRRLLRKHVLRPVIVVGGQRYVLRPKAEAYSRKRKRIARRALRELARVSQEAGLYP